MPIAKPDEEELGPATSGAATSASATVLEASRSKFVLAMESCAKEMHSYKRAMTTSEKVDVAQKRRDFQSAKIFNDFAKMDQRYQRVRYQP